MKELSTFVKDEFIKKKLFEEGLYIDNFDDITTLVAEANSGNCFNIVFENTYLKERFISQLKTVQPNLNIINCNSSLNRFFDNDFTGLLVFDNIKKCKDTRIIEEVKKYNAILIC